MLAEPYQVGAPDPLPGGHPHPVHEPSRLRGRCRSSALLHGQRDTRDGPVVPTAEGQRLLGGPDEARPGVGPGRRDGRARAARDLASAEEVAEPEREDGGVDREADDFPDPRLEPGPVLGPVDGAGRGQEQRRGRIEDVGVQPGRHIARPVQVCAVDEDEVRAALVPAERRGVLEPIDLNADLVQRCGDQLLGRVPPEDEDRRR